MPDFESQTSQYGVIQEIETDYSLVQLYSDEALKNPLSNRYFETDFLKACGLSGVGEILTLEFSKRADGHSGIVQMVVKPTGKVQEVSDVEPLSKLDLAKIKDAFGVHI